MVEIEAKEEMDIEVEKKWRLTRPRCERHEKLRARGVKKCPGPRMNPWIPSTIKGNALSTSHCQNTDDVLRGPSQISPRRMDKMCAINSLCGSKTRRREENPKLQRDYSAKLTNDYNRSHPDDGLDCGGCKLCMSQ